MGVLVLNFGATGTASEAPSVNAAGRQTAVPPTLVTNQLSLERQFPFRTKLESKSPTWG